MNTFLSRVVSDVLLKKKVENENLIFVLPSQRASVFLKNEIIKQISTASFLPQIKSIENYIQELSEIKQLDTIQLLFEFYSIYKIHTEKSEIDSFDVFSQWATIVLQDFNEVDRNLLDSKDLFTYLRDINRLKDWTPVTFISKKYFSFFEKLHLYYKEFYKYLISKKQGYQGLIYREAESNIHHYINNNLEKHIVFVGFNALNIAEEKIVQELLENRIASIYWDADSRYINTSKETGFFLRNYKDNWKYYQENPFNWTDDYLDINKNINFINATKNTSQLKYVGSLLQQKSEHNNTALVLADESLLSLTLNSLPKNIEKINITMGFPLNEIPLTEFFNSVFKLYIHQVKFENTSKNYYYYKDILSLFNHPYLRKLTINEGKSYFSNIRKNNRIFLSEKQISELFNE
ncbi:MAG: ATP-dependent helicase/nuclease subunit B, partial [Flavobacteriales bacterium]